MGGAWELDAPDVGPRGTVKCWLGAIGLYGDWYDGEPVLATESKNLRVFKLAGGTVEELEEDEDADVLARVLWLRYREDDG